MLILEYHRISKEEARWDRSISAFRNDLERLYALGFRPVLLSSYLKNDMQLAPGASPVVITFDDSDPSQIRVAPDGSLDPSSAVGIWAGFSAKHDDFPVRATFFVLPPVPWRQRDALPEKLALLKKFGCELGSHTMTHRSLAKLSDKEVASEIGKSLELISSWGFQAEALALPYGISPKNASLLRGFRYGTKDYSLKAALLVGAGPAPSPISPKLNPYRLPRIQSIEGDYGITYWLNKIAAGKVKPYVAL